MTVAALTATLFLASPARSDDRPSTPAAAAVDLSRIHIDNFARVDTGYYRGAEPEGSDYSDLAALGIRTLIDLRGSDATADEADMAARAGLQYVHIPMTTHETPTAAKLAAFLAVVTDPARQPVYVHCVGGRHRTGVMTAVYRMTHDGWSAEQAFKEMKAHKFGADFLHPEFKAFVYSFKPAAAVAAMNAAAGAADPKH